MPAERMEITLQVNGREERLEVPSHHSLLDVLRDRLRLTGAKECCVEGECGACTVIVDGRAVNSCIALAVELDGAEVTTVEGLGSRDRLSTLQEAFLAEGAVQCGFCIPGMVMSARSLLERIPHPSDEEIREGLSGNLCRCGGYNQIGTAVSAASRTHDE